MSGDADLAAEVQRLGALSLAALASEVMTKGFGAGGPGAESETSVADIARAMTPAFTADNADDARQQLLALVSEGLQILDHACLVRAEYLGRPRLDYVATRLGRAALADGSVASRLSA